MPFASPTTRIRGRTELEGITSLADLLDLHEVDLDIDRLLDERANLPELDEYKAAHEEVTRLEAAKIDADAALESVLS